MNRVVLVEDHTRLAALVGKALSGAGIEVDAFERIEPAWHALAEADYAALIVDRGLPDGDGLDLVRRLRAAGRRVPCLMLTARDALHDRVAGLEAGADDYLAKPFALEELLARLRALLRRSGWMDQREVLRFDDLELDPHSHEVRRGQRLIELTRTEFLLLELFLHHPR